MANFKALSWHFPGGIEEKHKNLPGQSVFGPISELREAPEYEEGLPTIRLRGQVWFSVRCTIRDSEIVFSGSETVFNGCETVLREIKLRLLEVNMCSAEVKLCQPEVNLCLAEVKRCSAEVKPGLLEVRLSLVEVGITYRCNKYNNNRCLQDKYLLSQQCFSLCHSSRVVFLLNNHKRTKTVSTLIIKYKNWDTLSILQDGYCGLSARDKAVGA